MIYNPMNEQEDRMLTFKDTVIGCVVLFAASTSHAAFPPNPPFNPEPLMEKVKRQVKGDRFSFVVFGDTKGSGAFPKVVERVKITEPIANFAVTVGDMVHLGGGEQGRKDYEKLERQFGQYMRTVPSWPVWGNHEKGGGKDSKENWHKFYGIKTRYSFTFKNAKFIILRLMWGPDPKYLKGEQLAWFKKELEGARGKHIFVFSHGPSYTVGHKSPGDHTLINSLCKKYKITAYFSGHDHIYYRTKRVGTTFIIQGCGGAGIYPLSHEDTAIPGDVYYGRIGRKGKKYKLHTAQGDEIKGKTYSFTLISVSGNKVSGKTVTTKGEVWDSFTLNALSPKQAIRKAQPGFSRTPAANVMKRVLKRYRLAEDMRRQGLGASARMIYAELAAKYPDTKIGKKAKARIEQLR